MYLSKMASRARLREAENARRNRREIVKALSTGQIDRRDLFKLGLFTTAGLLVAKHGLSPFASSAYADGVPTGAPPSPLGGVAKFTQPMPRPDALKPIPMVEATDTYRPQDKAYSFEGRPNEPAARNFSYHEQFSRPGNDADRRAATNPVTNRGPIEGRPPGEYFAHQRWAEIPPKVGYVLSLGKVEGAKFHPDLQTQRENVLWTFGVRPDGAVGDIRGIATGSPLPPLIRMRYDEPVLCRIYNDLPDAPEENAGFGRNEPSTHFHNAHNGAESDGACNAFHFPGTFYDYHWSTVIARRDLPTVRATDVERWRDKCSRPTDKGGFEPIEGDFREIQSTMWFHDHRFFFTAENVYKGHYGLINMYSGPDRGNEATADGINLLLPSGTERPWGNVDFDVNLAITNIALDQEGQLFYDIFDTDGFLGDLLCVNNAYAPYLDVLPRRYRFRMLNASMARFLRLIFAVNTVMPGSRWRSGDKVPVWVIANDGNLLPRPIRLTDIDTQGSAERFDVIVDFSEFKVGDSIRLVNVIKHKDGRGPDRVLTLPQALRGDPADPAVGPFLEFRVKSEVLSADAPGKTLYASSVKDHSVDFSKGLVDLTSQIPIDRNPVRTRTIEFKRGGGDSRDTPDGNCIPDCGEYEKFPWVIRVNGEESHSLNANRISALIPKPGEVEVWELVNGGGGWDHPIHLHFEEGVTIDRAGDPVPATERFARKDVWRLGQKGKRTVRMQVRFGEFGGAYVAHCHNTAHEDFAMLMRVQVLTEKGLFSTPTQTPMPSRDGVEWRSPEILAEGDPRRSKLAQKT